MRPARRIRPQPSSSTCVHKLHPPRPCTGARVGERREERPGDAEDDVRHLDTHVASQTPRPCAAALNRRSQPPLSTAVLHARDVFLAWCTRVQCKGTGAVCTKQARSVHTVAKAAPAPGPRALHLQKASHAMQTSARVSDAEDEPRAL